MTHPYDFDSLVGLLRHRARDRPTTVEEMKEAIRAKAEEKFGDGTRKPTGQKHLDPLKTP